MKRIDIGNYSFNVPEFNADMTEIITRVTDYHESGKLKGLFVIYATDDAYGGYVVGDAVHKVFCSMLAGSLAEMFLENFVRQTWNLNEDDDE